MRRKEGQTEDKVDRKNNKREKMGCSYSLIFSFISFVCAINVLKSK